MPSVSYSKVGRKLAAVRRELVGFTDARVKLCTEVVTGAPFLLRQRSVPPAICVCALNAELANKAN